MTALAREPRSASRAWSAILLLLVAAACGRPAAAPVDVTFRLTPAVPLTGRVAWADLIVASADGTPMRGARFDLEGHMTHPGMAPVVVPLIDDGDGRYRAAITLTMAGDWVMFVSGQTADGQAVRQRVAALTARPDG